MVTTSIKTPGQRAKEQLGKGRAAHEKKSIASPVKTIPEKKTAPVKKQTGDKRQITSVSDVINRAAGEKIQKPGQLDPKTTVDRFERFQFGKEEFGFDDKGKLTKIRDIQNSTGNRVVGIESGGRTFNIGDISDIRDPLQKRVSSDVKKAQQIDLLFSKQAQGRLGGFRGDTGIEVFDESKDFGSKSFRGLDTLPGEISGAAKIGRFQTAGDLPGRSIFRTSGVKSSADLVNVDFADSLGLFDNPPDKEENEDSKDFAVRVAKFERDQVTEAFNNVKSEIELQKLNESIRDVTGIKRDTGAETSKTVIKSDLEHDDGFKSQFNIAKDQYKRTRNALAEANAKQRGRFLTGNSAVVDEMRKAILAEEKTKAEQDIIEFNGETDKKFRDSVEKISTAVSDKAKEFETLTDEEIRQKAIDDDIAQREDAYIDEGFTPAEAEAKVKREISNIGSDPTLNDALQSFKSMATAGEITTENAFEKAMGIPGINGSTVKATSVLQAAGLTDTIIKKQKRAYQTDVLKIPNDLLDPMEGIEGARQLMDTVRNGGGNKLGTDVWTIGKQLQSSDPTGTLEKAWYKEVLANPNTNFLEQSIAQGLLDDVGGDIEERFISGDLEPEEETAFLERTRLLENAKRKSEDANTTSTTFSTPRASDISSFTSDEEFENALSKFSPDEIRDAEALMNPLSQLKLSDLSTKGNHRARVDSVLNVLKQKAMLEGDINGIILASAGGKIPSEGTLTSMEKAVTVINQIGELQESLKGENTGPIIGILKSNNPFDEKARLIQAQLTSIIPNLARGVYGEVGVLTDNDVELYRKTLPNLTSQEDLADALLSMTIRTIQRGLENKIRLNAQLGRDMSGIAETYRKIKQNADNLLPQVTTITEKESVKIEDLTDDQLNQAFEDISTVKDSNETTDEDLIEYFNIK